MNAWLTVRAIVLLLLPFTALRRWWLRLAYRAQVSPTAHIAPCWLRLHTVRLGPRARIGIGVYVDDTRLLELEANAVLGARTRVRFADCVSIAADATIGRGTLLLGAPITPVPELRRFSVGQRSTITHGHYFDLTDTITIAEDVVIGGRQSEFWTHGFDVVRDRIQGPIRIDARSYVGSRVLVGPGATLPPDSFLAMGACLVYAESEPGRLYAGVPAKDRGPARHLAERPELDCVGPLLTRNAYRLPTRANVLVPHR